MNELIQKFIEENTCATICCINEAALPYCFNCYYAYNSKDQLLYYKSSLDTQHSMHILINPQVAGSILPDKLNKLQVKGIQFQGTVLPAEHHLAVHATTDYYLKNPMAVAVPGQVWTVQINQIKYTDNTLGFGKKLFWDR
jgi:uncharacterized protein YhbP (UPF0306 family)